jgi:hypothetical protein
VKQNLNYETPSRHGKTFGGYHMIGMMIVNHLMNNPTATIKIEKKQCGAVIVDMKYKTETPDETKGSRVWVNDLPDGGEK